MDDVMERRPIGAVVEHLVLRVNPSLHFGTRHAEFRDHCFERRGRGSERTGVAIGVIEGALELPGRKVRYRRAVQLHPIDRLDTRDPVARREPFRRRLLGVAHRGCAGKPLVPHREQRLLLRRIEAGTHDVAVGDVAVGLGPRRLDQPQAAGSKRIQGQVRMPV